MRTSTRTVLATLAFVSIATTADAQLKLLGKPIEEIRADVASLTLNNGTGFGVGIPGTLAVGIYYSDKIALEPGIGLAYISPDGGESSTAFVANVMVPYYVAGDRGRSGLFVAPMMQLVKAGDADMAIDIGADIGTKRKLGENLSMRMAGTLRTGDTTGDELQLGASLGISLFLKP